MEAEGAVGELLDRLGEAAGLDAVAEDRGREGLQGGGGALGGGRALWAVVGGVGEGQDALGALEDRAELQGLHDAGEGGAVGAQVLQVPGGVDAEVEVGEEPVETAVAQDVVEVVTQGLAGLSLDLVGAGDDAVEAVVLGDPLGGGLGADPGHAGQVVARLADEGGQVRVALGGDAVALLDLGRRHPAQGGHALDGVEHGAALGDGLEGVAVAGAQEDLHARPLAGGGQCGEDVVGLVAVLGEPADAHRVEDLLDELDLADEGLGRGVAGALVLGVLLGAEGAAREVEGHGHMRGGLLLDEGEQHGGEAVDGVGGLAGGGREVLHGQGVVGPEGHGVAVDEEQAARGSVRG